MDHSATPTPTTARVGVPTTGGGLSRDDYLTIYGPLGIGWLITLGILAVLWRDRNAQRREFLETTEKRDKAQRAEIERLEAAHAAEVAHIEEARRADAVRYEDQLRDAAREAHEVARQINSEWREFAQSMRDVMAASTRRIARREDR